MKIDPDKSFGDRECPSCGVTVEANSNRCPICGYEFPNRTPASQGLRWTLGIFLLLLFLLMVLR